MNIYNCYLQSLILRNSSLQIINEFVEKNIKKQDVVTVHLLMIYFSKLQLFDKVEELYLKHGKGPFEQICDTFVLMQLPDIIDQIIAKEKPSLVCAQIHMCSNSTMVPKVAAKDTVNETLQNLETQLEQVCTVVPAQYSAICKYVVDSYLPQFIHNVEQSFPPKKCCQIVGLCSDSASKQQQKPKVVAPVPPIPVNNSPLCPLCKATVNFLKPQVENLQCCSS
ncbi:hypothetical protein ABK040_003930 [Willaertia magna]